MVMVGGRDPRRMMCWSYNVMVSGENGRWRSEVNGMRNEMKGREEEQSEVGEEMVCRI